jgi:hypothetical protein
VRESYCYYKGREFLKERKLLYYYYKGRELLKERK